MLRRDARRLFRLFGVAALAAGSATSCADHKKAGEGAEALPAPVKLSPVTLELGTTERALGLFKYAGLSPAPRAAWALFDRDTTTGYEPKLDEDGQVVLRVGLDGPSELTHVKVFGPSPYVLDVLVDGDAV